MNQTWHAILTVVMTAIVVVGLCYLLFDTMRGNTQQIIQDLENVIAAQNDTISYYQDRDGNQVAKIQSFETQSVKDFLKINFQDSTIQKLQYEMEKYKKKELQYVAIIESYTKLDTTTKVKYITTDVINQPIYIWEFKDEWITLNDTVSYDNNKFSLKVRNDFNIVSRREKNILITEVTNKNPYTFTTGLRSYSTAIPKQKRFGLGINTGWSPWSGWYGGVGLNYTIIPLW